MSNKIKVGDMVVLSGDKENDIAYKYTIETMTEGKSYKVFGIGTPPEGWPANENGEVDDVYTFDDEHNFTQLGGGDVTLVHGTHSAFSPTYPWSYL